MAELRSDPMVMRTYPDPADAIEAYLRFIYLAAVLPKGAVPNKAIDAVWHAHISHTRAYSQFCRTVVRRFIHHNPSPRTPSGPDEATRDRFRETQEAERREFSRASLDAAEASHGGGLILGFFGAIALIFAALFVNALFSAKTLTVLVLVGVIVVAFHYIVRATNTEPQPAGHPARKKKPDQSGSDNSGGAGPEVFYLSGQAGGSTGDGCSPGATTAEACALDGNGGHGDGGSTGDGDGGTSCSSCGGGGD